MTRHLDALDPSFIRDAQTLLARACTAIDTLDDIDLIAALGGPMDALAAALREHHDVRLVHEVVCIAGRARVETDQVARMLASATPLVWRTRWLVRHLGCEEQTAAALAALDGDTFAHYASDPDTLPGFIALLQTQVREETDAVRHALEAHEATAPLTIAIPDTVPAHW